MLLACPMRRWLFAAVVLVGLGTLMVGGLAWWALVPRPPTVTVVRGDTLFLIAQAHGVTVADLRRWNGIEGDLIEVGQVLIVGSIDADAPTADPDAPTVQPPTARRPGPARPRPSAGSPPAPRRMPPPKRCLSGPEGTDLGEAGMAASTGLTQAQARSALDAFVGEVLPCIHGAPTAALQLELNVACTGQVQSVRIADQGDWPADVADCVADTLGYTPFPAHGLPDGDVVFYPLRYTPP